MPTDSREFAYSTRERWLIRGLWASQMVAGPGVWVLLIWSGYRVAVWISSLVGALGAGRATTALFVILLATATILCLAVSRRGDRDN